MMIFDLYANLIADDLSFGCVEVPRSQPLPTYCLLGDAKKTQNKKKKKRKKKKKESNQEKIVT